MVTGVNWIFNHDIERARQWDTPIFRRAISDGMPLEAGRVSLSPVIYIARVKEAWISRDNVYLVELAAMIGLDIRADDTYACSCNHAVWYERAKEYGGGYTCGICHPAPDSLYMEAASEISL